MENKKLIRFDDDIFFMILESCKIKKINFTKEVNRLLRKGLISDDVCKELFTIKKELKDIKKFSFDSFDICKQIYANLELPLKNMNDSEYLKEYMRRKNILND